MSLMLVKGYWSEYNPSKLFGIALPIQGGVKQGGLCFICLDLITNVYDVDLDLKVISYAPKGSMAFCKLFYLYLFLLVMNLSFVDDEFFINPL